MHFLTGPKGRRRRRDDDGDGDEVMREFFVMHDRWIRDRRHRLFFVHALVVVGAAQWATVLWPSAPCRDAVPWLTLTWGVFLTAGVASGMSERVSRRRFERASKELGEPPPGPFDGRP